MSVVPCQQNKDLNKLVEEFAETLKTQAHVIGDHGLSERDFYQGGLFRGAIERIRGQFAADMAAKRDFVRQVLNYMQDHGYITGYEEAGGKNRHDYSIVLPDGRTSVVELKGGLDGNNTNIFERPPHAQEFLIWSIASNATGDPRRNVWSGIHTRLSAEIIDKKKQVDGLIVWDWICGTIGRPCPKLQGHPERKTVVGQFSLTPPCLYLFPKTVPSVRQNPDPEPHTVDEVGFIHALHKCFGGRDEELNTVRFAVAHQGNETVRTTTVYRDGQVQHRSKPTTIRRT